jgi:hypothetical protein
MGNDTPLRVAPLAVGVIFIFDVENRRDYRE